MSFWKGLAQDQLPHKRCCFCGEGVTCAHGKCEVCQSCRRCDREERPVRNPIFDDPEAMKAVRYLALKYPVEIVMEWFKTALTEGER